MGRILVLDELTACKIAAGEVVERPASVVKEMVENSIDAGASKIVVEIKNGGIKYIRIEDNGGGFEPDDAIIAFDKHATSKIRSADDLFCIDTLGFRGEALASIAAVSEVELTTKQRSGESGVFVKFAGGELVESGECGCKDGSAFIVRNLFYNTPARYKFLKKDSTEAGYVADVLQKLALSHPDVSIKFISDNKTVLHTPGNGDSMSCVYSIFGKQIASFIREIKYSAGGIAVTGFAGVKEAVYGNRSRQFCFINRRFVRSKTVTSAIDEAYKTITMKGKFPFIILNISLNPSSVDVNVHPTKTEVRFSDEGAVFRAVYHGIQNALFGEDEFAEKPTAEAAGCACVSKSKNTSAESTVSSDVSVRDTPFKRDMSGKISSSVVSLFETAERMKEKNERTTCEREEYEIVKDTQEAENEMADNKSTFDGPPGSTGAATAEIPLQNTEAFVKNNSSPEKSVTDSSQLPGSDEKQPPSGQVYGDSDIYVNGTVIGQFLDTYILLQYKDELVLLDQHAAHERLMYEKIKRALMEEENESQLLLAPVTIQLSPSEFAVYSSNTLFFEKAGFDIEEFGANSIVVRSVPMILVGSDIERFIVSGIELAASGKEKLSLFSDNAVYTMACKAAIKANRRLRTEEIDSLLRELAGVKNPGTCPHGRPITVRYTKYEIERKFHRC